MNKIRQADIEPTLKRIVEIAQKATVPCQCNIEMLPCGIHSIGDNCDECHSCYGANRIQDPALRPLLDVLKDKCDWCKGQGKYNIYTKPVHRIYKVVDPCRKCEGTGFVLRNWDGLPEGALAGALEWSFPGILSASTADYDNKWAYFRTEHPANSFEYVSSDRLPPDQAALQAVLCWLEVKS